MTLLGKGRPTEGVVGKLHDAQGAEIPIDAVQDMEIRLKDVSGSTVILRERVAVSKHVSQPILSFGRLLEGGWSIDGCQQALTHHAGANIPVELQNKSLMVQGTIVYVFCVSHVMLLTCMSGQFKLMSWNMLLKDVLDGI